MKTRSFQAADLTDVVLTNLDTHASDDLRLSLMPDGALFIEPGAWPDGTPSSSFDQPILLTPQQTEALWRFFDGPRVRDRMLDRFRRRLLRHGSPELRKLIRAIDRCFDQPTP